MAREVNQAERPLEDAPKAISAEEKALKNAEEVARWDEKKKWELKVEHFKKKLEEANEEVSKVVKGQIASHIQITNHFVVFFGERGKDPNHFRD